MKHGHASSCGTPLLCLPLVRFPQSRTESCVCANVCARGWNAMAGNATSWSARSCNPYNENRVAFDRIEVVHGGRTIRTDFNSSTFRLFSSSRQALLSRAFHSPLTVLTHTHLGYAVEVAVGSDNTSTSWRRASRHLRHLSRFARQRASTATENACSI